MDYSRQLEEHVFDVNSNNFLKNGIPLDINFHLLFASETRSQTEETFLLEKCGHLCGLFLEMFEKTVMTKTNPLETQRLFYIP